MEVEWFLRMRFSFFSFGEKNQKNLNEGLLLDAPQESFGQAFSKACGFQRQSLGRSSQRAKHPFRCFLFGSFFFWLEQERAQWATKRLRSTEKTRSIGRAPRVRDRDDYVFDRALLSQKKKRIISEDVFNDKRTKTACRKLGRRVFD